MNVSLLVAFFCLWTPCSVAESMLQNCNNEKFSVEKEFRPFDVLRCPGPPWPESKQELASIDRKYRPQLVNHVSVDPPLTFHHSIPNSGPHRPVGAESREYLYCLPQQWLHNLQHGATIFLYHPCGLVRQRPRLSVLARACVSGYIVTPHPLLSAQRPFALVSWGHTLEMARVTVLEACDWLERNARGGQRCDSLRVALGKDRKWNITQQERPRTIGETSLGRCCRETLSLLREAGMEDGKRRVRVSRAILLKEERLIEDDGPTEAVVEGNETHRASPAPQRFQTERSGATQRLRWSHAPGPEHKTNAAKKGGMDGLDGGASLKRKKLSGRHRMSLKEYEKQGVAKKEEGGEKQWSEEEEKEQQLGDQVKGRAERRDCACPGRCSCTEAVAPVGGAVLAERMPTSRTDEAVWAAAALGFLLVLLTLSVLHTRLYRHWRVSPSLYWRDPQQDYDTVADIIQRRLRMSGRQKRKVPHGRKKECVLPPGSSTDESN